MKIVLATGNAGKLAEMQAMLESCGLSILPQGQLGVSEAIEDGLSFVENALIKARHASDICKLPAIADDSGLEVDALDGAPGIYSARYADGAGDQANNEKLLTVLEGEQNRRARFRCVIVCMRHALDPTPLICSGSWEGEIANQPKGSNGFGYDPIFYDPVHACHSAEMDAELKNRVSHRAKALTLFKDQISDFLVND